jgi:hypothetical protein
MTAGLNNNAQRTPRLRPSEPNAPLTWGLRLFVEPHFRLEFIDEVV